MKIKFPRKIITGWIGKITHNKKRFTSYYQILRIINLKQAAFSTFKNVHRPKIFQEYFVFNTIEIYKIRVFTLPFPTK